MKKLTVMLCALGLCAGGGANARDLDNPAAAFGHRPAVRSIALSPSGNRVVFLGPGTGEETGVYVADVSGGRSSVVTTTDGDPMNMNWCRFVNEDRLVCEIYALLEDSYDQYRAEILPVRRLFAVNDDASDPRQLGQRRTGYRRFRQFDGAIIDWLPGEEDVVMMSRVYTPESNRTGSRIVDNDEGMGVVRINTRTGNTDRVVAPARQYSRFLTDGHGNVRVRGTYTSRGATGMLGSNLNYDYRLADDGEWRDLSSYDVLEEEGFYPVLVDHDLNAVYGFEDLNGRDALYRVSLDGSMARELVSSHDDVDIRDLVVLGRQQRAIGVSYSEDYPVIEYFDAQFQALADALKNALPGNPSIRFVDASDDETRLLIEASSDTNPGRYYVFDRASGSLNEILLARPELEGVPLSEVRPISYPAADGTMIPAYLTLPPGSDGRNLPAIVMPHGGPQARDDWGFDWLAQFFAHQGYAVLQPNFRGSAGYGEEWLVENGFQGWETAIGDVDDGVRWLISEGIANAEQVAGVGWSYGGYAVLQSAVHEPGLLRAIVAIAPVTDLPALREDARAFVNGRNVAEYLGSGPHITAGSPARHADRVTAPVLLFHGDQDLNVDIGQSRRMHDRLQDAGARSELVVFEGLDHSLVDSEVRAQMLERSDAFLREALGL